MAKKDFDKVVDDMVSLSAYLTSVNGFPIYDLMVKVYCDNGYGDKLLRWGASGVVFYSEDPTVLKSLCEVPYEEDVEDIRKFLKSNKSCLSNLSDIGVKVMSDKAAHAFHHLTARLDETMREGYYGVAHLIEDGKVLVFHQSSEKLNKLYYGADGKPIDMRDSSNYEHAQSKLLKLYKAGVEKPEAEIYGLAFDKVMSSMKGMPYHTLNKFQKDCLAVLDSFFQSSAKVRLAKDKQAAVISSDSGLDVSLLLPLSEKDEVSCVFPGEKRCYQDFSEAVLDIQSFDSKLRFNKAAQEKGISIRRK